MSYKPLNTNQMSFVSEHVKKRTRKNLFFSQINQIIDWEPIEKERGCKAYNPLLLFKMQLVSEWYDLSDV